MLLVNNPLAIEAISKATQVSFNKSRHTCFANVTDVGKVLGGVLFTNYEYASVQIHVAGFDDRWLSRHLLFTAFDFAFNELKVVKILAMMKSTNKKALAFNRNLGFIDEAVIADVFVDADMVIRSMTKEQCKFLDRKLALPKPVRAASPLRLVADNSVPVPSDIPKGDLNVQRL